MAAWSFEELFPLIAHIIDRTHAETGAPVTRDQIRDALLSDPIGAAQVNAAAPGQNRSPEIVAGNMVDWWSAEESKGTNEYAEKYVRLTIDRKAAYRPRIAANGSTYGMLTDDRVSATDGQGSQLDPRRRAAVEQRAMVDAREWLAALGWAEGEITDTSAGNPYDLRAERLGERLFVEVKGTTGLEPTVIVTRGEVRHAVAHPDECALFVLAGITVVDVAGLPHGTGGMRHTFLPWRPLEGTLLPISYRHDPR